MKLFSEGKIHHIEQRIILQIICIYISGLHLKQNGQIGDTMKKIKTSRKMIKRKPSEKPDIAAIGQHFKIILFTVFREIKGMTEKYERELETLKKNKMLSSLIFGKK